MRWPSAAPAKAATSTDPIRILSFGLRVEPRSSFGELRRLEDPFSARCRLSARLERRRGDLLSAYRVSSSSCSLRLHFFPLPPAPVSPSPEAEEILLYPGSVSSLLRVEEARVQEIPRDESRRLLQPLPADPDALLDYDRKEWRWEEFEIFSWDVLPGFLIFDTASYRVQDRMFKRVAFFTEKRGFRGRLVRDEEFQGLHGYNAHDYAAEDLALFFNRAAAEGFKLNPQEERLRGILLANGVLREGEGKLSAARGGLLSISRQSSPVLRRHLLTHELMHGVFFLSPEYCRACFQIWEETSTEEKGFWSLFLSWGGYDVEAPSLVVNEFQAYLLQQERSQLNPYFRELVAGRLQRSYPDQSSWIRALFENQPGCFRESFDRLEEALYNSAGLEGGKALRLIPAPKGEQPPSR